MNKKQTVFPWLLCICWVVLWWGSVAGGVTINRINGGMSVVYVDFNIPGDIVPLELVRSYNSITGINEKTGWSGAFGWGWTSDFETRITVTPNRNLLLRDGNTGNNVLFKPVSEKPSVMTSFMEKLKRKLYVQEKGKSPTESQIKAFSVPREMSDRVKSDPGFRQKLAVQFELGVAPQNGLLESSAYGYESIYKWSEKWYRTKDGIIYVFDKDGRLVQKKDRNGYFVNYTYSRTNKFELREIVAKNQTASLRFLWRKGRVVRVTDNLGSRSTYKYDKQGNLTKIKDSTGKTYAYKYTKKKFPHLLTGIDYLSEIKNKKAPKRVFDYDKNGLVVFHKTKNGGETKYVYGRSSNSPETNFWTRIIVLKKESGSDPDERFEEFSLKKRVDGSKYLFKQVSRNVYRSGAKRKTDEETTIFTACCGKPLQITKNGAVTKFKYYENGLLKRKNGPNISLQLEYDRQWGKVNKIVKNGISSFYEYDTKGNLVKARNSKKANIKLQYDPAGRISTMINGKGQSIKFAYGSRGKPVRITQERVGTIVIAYDSSGKIKRTETYLGGGVKRTPTASESKRVVRQVMSGFQNLLDIIRPAAEVNKDGLSIGGL